MAFKKASISGNACNLFCKQLLVNKLVVNSLYKILYFITIIVFLSTKYFTLTLRSFCHIELFTPSINDKEDIILVKYSFICQRELVDVGIKKAEKYSKT